MKDDKQNDRQGVAPPDKDMREAFEEALPFIGGTIHVFSPTRTARDERYLEGVTEVCWRTWQAAFSRASSSRAEVERDAERYRVFRDIPSFALTMNHWSTPEIIDALCDKVIADAAPDEVPSECHECHGKGSVDVTHEPLRDGYTETFGQCCGTCQGTGKFAAAEAPNGDQS